MQELSFCISSKVMWFKMHLYLLYIGTRISDGGGKNLGIVIRVEDVKTDMIHSCCANGEIILPPVFFCGSFYCSIEIAYGARTKRGNIERRFDIVRRFCINVLYRHFTQEKFIVPALGYACRHAQERSFRIFRYPGISGIVVKKGVDNYPVHRSIPVKSGRVGPT